MSRRRAGSVRFDDYFKAQWYDRRSLTWCDVQRAYETEAACRESFDPKVSLRWRVMQVTETGRFPLAVTDLIDITDLKGDRS